MLEFDKVLAYSEMLGKKKNISSQIERIYFEVGGLTKRGWLRPKGPKVPSVALCKSWTLWRNAPLYSYTVRFSNKTSLYGLFFLFKIWDFTEVP